MKKIDLHVHTVSTVWDSNFDFDLDKLQEYVSLAKLDAIAITNHNLFDSIQFNEIANALESVLVLPGIEVTLDRGHVLVIADTTNLNNFEGKTGGIAQRIRQVGDGISVEELKQLFGDLSEYLVIPHYDKGPSVKSETLAQIEDCVLAGEVDSAKKFIRTIKDDSKLTPVLFSDVRIHSQLPSLPTRHTFIDCGELTLNAIKTCLRDKKKVALSEADGNSLFQILDDGQMLSTGLNVLLGERSSGKTFTLDRISEAHDNVKYIKQFSLVQQDNAADEREFNKELQRVRSQFIEEYLSEFKVVLNDVINNVDLGANTRAVENYVSSLIKSAEEADKRDSFSNAALFDESEFPISDEKVLIDLIASVRQIIENVEYQEIIAKYLEVDSLKRLAHDLIQRLWIKAYEKKKKMFVNELVRDIKRSLKMRTAAVQVEDIDLYRVIIDKRKINRFTEIVKCLQKESIISEDSIQGFSVIAQKGPFTGAGEVKSASGVRTAFQDSFQKYGEPYDYLRSLLDNDSLTPSELYKLFSKISYRILNKDGFDVSGGERSEFRLLQEIKDAQNYDILLIDEPESSFDNLFLKSDVNQIIREISKSMPIVVVTHNSTVGASIDADYLLYASKEIDGGNVVYRLYSGHPTDHNFVSLDGKTISSHEKMLNSLEAGYETYTDRRQRYEAIKD